MSEFRTRLVTEREDMDHGKEKLVRPLVYFSDIAGEIVVPVGFETDLASVPRLPVAYLLFGDTARGAAVVHDYLYDRRLLPRATADAVFVEAMAVSGVPWWRRSLMWAAVRLAGGSSYDG